MRGDFIHIGLYTLESSNLKPYFRKGMTPKNCIKDILVQNFSDVRSNLTNYNPVHNSIKSILSNDHFIQYETARLFLFSARLFPKTTHLLNVPVEIFLLA